MPELAPGWSYRCAECEKSFALEELVWRCPCAGLLELERPWAPPSDEATWLPDGRLGAEITKLSLGEGATPLVRARSGLGLKLDYIQPTGSYKDRGAVLLVALASCLGVRSAVADSSGNAGVALATYAARAGIQLTVFVPDTTSAKKLAQLRALGAVVQEIPGGRQAAAEAALDRVSDRGVFYASHVYNPLFFAGTAMTALEIYRQGQSRAPEAVITPVGNGTMLLGLSQGFAALRRAGAIERTPRLVAVQAERCAPLVTALAPPYDYATVAEGIAIPAPPRRRQLLDAVAASEGEVVLAPEPAILAARTDLRAEGIDVEPTAAAAYAGWLAWRDRPAGTDGDPPPDPQRSVLVLTGSGLKA